MGFSGMNPAAIESVARELVSCSSRINGVRGAVDSIVQRTQANWVGQDASHFAADWQSNRSSLTTISQAMQDLSNRAKNQANAQRKASNQ